MADFIEDEASHTTQWIQVYFTTEYYSWDRDGSDKA